MHSLDPFAGWYLPEGHRGQRSSPGEAPYCPGGHSEQLDDPGPAYEPAEHTPSQLAAAIVTFANLPGSQSAHAVVDLRLYLPFVQAMHVVALVLSRVSVTEPFEHSLHVIVATEVLNLPEAHSEQLLAPSSLLY